MASSILSPNSQILPNTAAVLGLAPIALGTNAIFRPRSALGLFDFSPVKDAEAQKLIDNLMRIYGARDLAYGLSVLIAWYYGHREALGWIFVAGTIIALVDAWATRLQKGKGEWNHLPFAILGVGLGGGILGWFGGL